MMRAMAQHGLRFTQPQIKSMMKMLLQGLAAVHNNGLMHRDLKPANLLFTASGVLKLGDFGLARAHDRSCLYSHEVATRWYRAPELLFGARVYTEAVDIWATGCIFAELLLHSPFFPGELDIDQIARIFARLGTPTLRQWPGLGALPDFHKISFPALPAQPLQSFLPDASPEAIALLEQMFAYDPARRISARAALLNDYFFTGPAACHASELQPLVELPLRAAYECVGHRTRGAFAPRLDPALQQGKESDPSPLRTFDLRAPLRIADHFLPP